MIKTILTTGLCVFCLTTTAATHYVRFSHSEGSAVSYGTLNGDTITELDNDYFHDPKATGRTFARKSVTLLLPLDPANVSKVIGTAINTKREGLNVEKNSHPRWFAKFPTSLNPTDAGVLLPPEATNLNYEGELVVVIGKKTRHVSEAEALDYVFGYAVGNDFSENTWYVERNGRAEPTRMISKGSDTWACLGSAIVTGLDYANRRVVTTLNGEVVQDGNTNQLIQNVPELVANLSRYITLLPGDLIYTGTVPFKEGVRRQMRIGDKLTVSIEGIGSVSNTIVAMEGNRK